MVYHNSENEKAENDYQPALSPDITVEMFKTEGRKTKSKKGSISLLGQSIDG